MIMLDNSHPLYKGIRVAYNSCARRNFQSCKRHPSPPHRLLNKFKINPYDTETITPIRHYPKWEPDITTQVAVSGRSHNRRHHRTGRHTCVLGRFGHRWRSRRSSGIDKRRRRSKREEFHLGSDKEHTVYEGELVGMILAAELLKEEGRQGTLALRVDNQAAIKATGGFNSKAGHYLMDTLHDDLRKLIPTHYQHKLIVRWSPGHQGIPGNEAADEHAKLAAGGDNTEARLLPRSLKKRNGTVITLPISKSALKQQFHHKIKKEAAAVMAKSPRYPLLRKIDSSAPSKHFSLLVTSLPRRHSSLLFQLRTGHVPLNKHLHCIAKAPNPICQHCHLREETVHHFLIV
ncbi:hypothetical protein AZE42_11430 [Rhizopogon vesiculosus]|uniref:RNase H type-1 domain-containing protein n=1 Tax=Rhizopogon vesiculosus TaxID=180088 RepID=A0A1J8R070_9AGAM|nr:hypothetical protein AZE42_11430 [Rhizopogon vesiculosus]